MTLPRLSKLELKIMNVLWTDGDLAIREVQEALPARKRPAYTTVQTTIYRLEAKGAVKRVKKIGNAHIFTAVASRKESQGRLVDELLSMLDGHSETVMAHLIESGNLTLDDVREAEKTLRKLASRKGGE
jgi:BlaI family penicillinase repressor